MSIRSAPHSEKHGHAQPVLVLLGPFQQWCCTASKANNKDPSACVTRETLCEFRNTPSLRFHDLRKAH
eukprot:11178097-Lingulodinium_polyedra.AAC.1